MSDTEVKKEDIKIVEQPQEKKIDEQEIKPKNLTSDENEGNWRKFREDRERERKQKEDSDRLAVQKTAEAEALKAAMEALLNKTPQQPGYNEYGGVDESEEQRIEKKIQAALEKERHRYEEERRKQDQATFPNRLVQNHPDFNHVCNTENLDYLEYHYPEVTNAFKYMPDGYEKWENVYKAVKKFVPSQNKREDDARMQKNMMKPQANVPHLTDTQPQTSGWRLTEERRKENWARMQRDRKSM